VSLTSPQQVGNFLVVTGNVCNGFWAIQSLFLVQMLWIAEELFYLSTWWLLHLTAPLPSH